jgi:CHASE2 domain-containing sensor protein
MKNAKKSIFLAISITFLIYITIYGFLKVAFININFEFSHYFKSVLTEKVNPNIIIVEIDDLTYNKLGFPIDR